MSYAKRAGDRPTKVDLEADETYAYCACGQSANQPFCDGAHRGSGFRPHIFKA
ncbi:MAG: CDGSH iron-sulfur domain-containing protein [Opitutales bacterium]